MQLLVDGSIVLVIGTAVLLAALWLSLRMWPGNQPPEDEGPINE